MANTPLPPAKCVGCDKWGRGEDGRYECEPCRIKRTRAARHEAMSGRVIPQAPEKMRKCPQCEKEKPAAQFGRYAHSVCKECWRERKIWAKKQAARHWDNIYQASAQRRLHEAKTILSTGEVLCNRCKTIKPLADFTEHALKNTRWCRACTRLHTSERVAKNRGVEAYRRWEAREEARELAEQAAKEAMMGEQAKVDASASKRCTKCGLDKALSEFSTNGPKANGRLRSKCKPCEVLRKREWRKLKREATAEAELDAACKSLWNAGVVKSSAATGEDQNAAAEPEPLAEDARLLDELGAALDVYRAAGADIRTELDAGPGQRRCIDLNPGLEELHILYTNWKGVTRARKVMPLYLWYGATATHPRQWLMAAIDSKKEELRNFAVMDIHWMWTEEDGE